ncbi:ataxin-7-like protein 2a isoform X1 [Ictalurus furcatus]|uniref:ataxin-7-like protein 2a isoform X1 n=2 Tax=Ictalurus furcatus TaxID=66913 RepID=UPI00234FD15D|nr:ataxin-7-like protein 2a isoform X1 [Ictalurus furcatus]
MMAVRERAVKVMAALERRVPCLDDFVGQSWSVLAERINLTASDGSDGDDCSKNGKKTMETMTLRKEDMSIFGHYPGHDDFYLVVCSHCSQVVKPQAFEKHCERRHGSVGKLYAHLRSTPPAGQQRSHARHGHAPPTVGHGAGGWSGKSQSGGAARPSPQSPSTPPQFKHTKTPKDGVRLSPLEKTSSSGHSESNVFKQPPPLEPPRSSPPPSLRDPPWPYGGPSPSRPSPGSTEKSPGQRAETGSANATAPHARSNRPYKTSKKECDLDKHCGVLDPERKKVCTRLLTCNIHSIHQRRKVVGRSKNFDQLVAELKMVSKNRERSAQSHEESAAQSPSTETPREPNTAPLCRRPLSNSPAFRTRTLSENVPEDERVVREEGVARASSPLTQCRISSDESEGEGNEEPADWHSSPWHPKPLAVCTFGGFALGHGVFTFDRRLHHLRSAVSAMMENHLSAHLWKKIPQASEPQSQSSSAKPLAIPSSPSFTSHHSKQRAGNPSATSLKSSSFSSHGAGRDSSSSSRASAQSEKSGGSQSAAHSKPAQTATQPGTGRSRNPVGRPSKQQLRLRETERADPAAPAKRKGSLSEADTVSPDRNCVSPDRDRARLLGSGKTAAPPQIPALAPPSSHGQTNGSLSPGHKQSRAEPWPFKRTHTPGRTSPTEPGASGRAGNSGHHGRPTGYEHRGLGKKRKSSDSSPPSKVHRLPTPPHSGFYPWKESKGAPLPVGGEKKLSAPKPKLHR